jgi:hypothetical protein
VSCDGARVRSLTTTLRRISLTACRLINRVSRNTSGTRTLAAGSSFQLIPCWAKTAGGARCPCCATVCCGSASNRNNSLRRVPEVSCDGARVRSLTKTLRRISLAALTYISCSCGAILCAAISWYVTVGGTSGSHTTSRAGHCFGFHGHWAQCCTNSCWFRMICSAHDSCCKRKNQGDHLVVSHLGNLRMKTKQANKSSYRRSSQASGETA